MWTQVTWFSGVLRSHWRKSVHRKKLSVRSSAGRCSCFPASGPPDWRLHCGSGRRCFLQGYSCKTQYQDAVRYTCYYCLKLSEMAIIIIWISLDCIFCQECPNVFSILSHETRKAAQLHIWKAVTKQYLALIIIIVGSDCVLNDYLTNKITFKEFQGCWTLTPLNRTFKFVFSATHLFSYIL